MPVNIIRFAPGSRGEVLAFGSASQDESAPVRSSATQHQSKCATQRRQGQSLLNIWSGPWLVVATAASASTTWSSSDIRRRTWSPGSSPWTTGPATSIRWVTGETRRQTCRPAPAGRRYRHRPRRGCGSPRAGWPAHHHTLAKVKVVVGLRWRGCMGRDGGRQGHRAHLPRPGEPSRSGSLTL